MAPGLVELQPSMRNKVWGLEDLAPWFGKQRSKVGEVWFEADPPLPILLKFLFTSGRLSVQVHPPDREGVAGKAEMWYVLRAEPGARIALGFREPVSPERAREAACSGGIEDLLNWMRVRAGDSYYVPAGTVHAIGAGLALVEIQQNRDITYRLYDYGRPRELHLEEGLAVSDLSPYSRRAQPHQTSPGRRLLASCPYFATELIEAAGPLSVALDRSRFHLATITTGKGAVNGKRVRLGQVWLAAKATPELEICPEGSLSLLLSYLPD